MSDDDCCGLTDLFKFVGAITGITLTFFFLYFVFMLLLALLGKIH